MYTDLLTAGLIDDPYLDLNELKDSRIGHTVWAYRSEIEWHGSDEQRTDLVFDGLDTMAVISFNGEEIGRTFNQHRTYRFDVSGRMRPGANALEVRFDSAWEYAERIQAELGELPNAYPSPFNFVRKMAANFGWDWGPQLVTAGIWKNVRLESWTEVRLAEVRAALTLDDVHGVAHVTAKLALAEAKGGTSVSNRLLEMEIAGRKVKVSVPATVRDGELIDAEVRVPDAALWWPRGMGAPIGSPTTVFRRASRSSATESGSSRPSARIST
ncbi:MAG TPA: hypothetical protein VIG47_01665, partial [Gemmatimonadaceae bacterium]